MLAILWAVLMTLALIALVIAPFFHRIKEGQRHNAETETLLVPLVPHGARDPDQPDKAVDSVLDVWARFTGNAAERSPTGDPVSRAFLAPSDPAAVGRFQTERRRRLRLETEQALKRRVRSYVHDREHEV